jgi:hypothetical protein
MKNRAVERCCGFIDSLQTRCAKASTANRVLHPIELVHNVFWTRFLLLEIGRWDLSHPDQSTRSIAFGAGDVLSVSRSQLLVLQSKVGRHDGRRMNVPSRREDLSVVHQALTGDGLGCVVLDLEGMLGVENVLGFR